MLPPVGVRRCHLGGSLDEDVDEVEAGPSSFAHSHPALPVEALAAAAAEGSGISGRMSISDCCPPTATSPSAAVKQTARKSKVQNVETGSLRVTLPRPSRPTPSPSSSPSSVPWPASKSAHSTLKRLTKRTLPRFSLLLPAVCKRSRSCGCWIQTRAGIVLGSSLTS